MKETKQKRSLTENESSAVSAIRLAIKGMFGSTKPSKIKIRECQCCGSSLHIKGEFIGSICWKCGWEQDTIDGENEKSSMNYGLSPVEYHKLYNEVVNGEI